VTESDHNTVFSDDLKHETYEEYVDAEIFASRGDPDDFGGDYFNRQREDLAHRSLEDYVLDVPRWIDHGLFGLLLGRLDGLPSPERWRELKRADCRRCGAADVGMIEVRRLLEGPDGETAALPSDAILCESCEAAIKSYWSDHGELPPNLGRWSE